MVESVPYSSLQKLTNRKSARLIAEAASYPYSDYYQWWYVVDFMKRILTIAFATFEHRTNVRNLHHLSA